MILPTSPPILTGGTTVSSRIIASISSSSASGELISVGLNIFMPLYSQGGCARRKSLCPHRTDISEQGTPLPGRHDAEEQNICADRAKTCADGGLKHLRRCAGNPMPISTRGLLCVLSVSTMAVALPIFMASSQSKLAVCNASCAVCSKKSSHN